MLAADMPPLDEATLIHFGIKGMRWGVRKEDEPTGKKTGAKKSAAKSHNPYALNESEKAVLKAAGVDVNSADILKEKYGPGTLGKEQPKPKISPQQRQVVTAIVAGLGVAAASWYVYHRLNKGIEDDYFRRINPVANTAAKRDLAPFRKEWNNYLATAGGRERGYTKEMVDKLSGEETNLKAGTIFKRLSTTRETDIRPGGFYASYKEEDTARYKAILPVFWKVWGRPANSGYVVNLKANVDIKAPSPKKTFNMFKGILNDEVTHISPSGLPIRSKIRDIYQHSGGDDDSIARKIFPQFAGGWNNDNHPGTKHFFGKLRGEGYNAVVDMNDAGALASKPMRVIDGSLFSIAGHERVDASAIAAAQENIKAVVHAALAMMGMYTASGEAYLAHAGVKGMKWGIRKAKDPSSDPDRQRRNEILVKTAMTVGAVAVGAILLKRGGFKLSTPASKKIMLGGAKIALRILQKSGRIMATTSVKVGSTVGKTAVKGSAKVGTLVGKGAYNGALAGSKAAGRAIAQNGSKFYERGIKGAGRGIVKVGSHAMYKLTGRGTAAATEIAKKSINLSPTDLLLNVRADKWRGR